VTEDDWNDVWLSEGFATYFTLLYTEYATGREAFVEGLRRSRDNVLRVQAAALQYHPSSGVLARYGDKSAIAPSGKANAVWVSNGTTIAPEPVTTGASDGIYTELVSAPFDEGTAVVTR